MASRETLSVVTEVLRHGRDDVVPVALLLSAGCDLHLVGCGALGVLAKTVASVDFDREFLVLLLDFAHQVSNCLGERRGSIALAQTGTVII